MVNKQKVKAAEEETMEEKADLNKLSELSGESLVKSFRYIVPILKFNGNTGKFKYLIPDTEGNYVPQQAEDEPEFVILKIRRVGHSYEKTPSGSITHFTNEHNSWRDEVVLFESVKSGGVSSKPKMVDKGVFQDIRTRWPKLKIRQNLYVLYKGEVVKFGVRGKSLSSLYDYYKVFGPQEHIFQFITKLQCHEETNEGGLTYYVLDFIKGEKADIEEVASKINEVAENLKLQDKSYQEMPEKMEEEIEKDRMIGELPLDHLEKESEVENNEEEIDSGSIPF